MKPRLTVMIPTISPRTSLLSRNLWHISQQPGDIEVLVHADDTMGMGDKFNEMVELAASDYVVQVDDDDYLTLDYLHHVLPYLDGRYDFIGYRILYLNNGQFAGSIAHDAENPFGVFPRDRGVCPKMPIRKHIAAQVSFGNDYEDDWPWSREVHNRVRESTFIDRHLYIYDWYPGNLLGTKPEDHPENWSRQRDVGNWPWIDDRVFYVE